MRSLVYALGCCAMVGSGFSARAAEGDIMPTSDASVEADAQETTQPEAESSATLHSYPEAVVQRPSTVPVGSYLASAAVTSNFDLSVTEVAPSVTYGLSHRLDGSLALVTSTYDGKRSNFAKPAMTYFLFGADPVFVSLKGAMPVHFQGDAVRDFSIGVSAAYVLTPRAVVYASDLRFYVNVSPETYVTLPVDLNFGYQVTDKVWVAAKTYLARMSTKKGETSTILDKTPAYLESTISLGSLFDVGVTAGFSNVRSPKETLAVTVSTTYKGI